MSEITEGGVVRGDDEEVEVTAPSRLDAVEAPALRRELEALVAGGALHVVVDLRGTDVVDSAGLAALVSTMIVLRRRGGDLAIHPPASAAAWRVFDLTGLADVFVHRSPRAVGG